MTLLYRTAVLIAIAGLLYQHPMNNATAIASVALVIAAFISLGLWLLDRE